MQDSLRKQMVLVIVSVALLLDNMLLTCVVPIVPTFLFKLNHPNSTGILADSNFSVALRKQMHGEFVNESLEVSLLFLAKPLVQGLTNPFTGPISNRTGFPIILFAGFVIFFVTSLTFAMGTSYVTLLIARTVQGVGSSCTSVAGMGILAQTYPDDRERSSAMAVALGGLAIGVLIGPVYGGTLYEFVDKKTPFLILAGMAVLDGALQMVVLHPFQVKKANLARGPTIYTLLKDQYILTAAGSIAFANIGLAVLEPSLPLWMMDTMEATKWQQGMAFLPPSMSYLVGTNLFGYLSQKFGRWLVAMVGMLTIGVCLICVPLAKSLVGLTPTTAGIGFAIGMVDSSMMPMLGYLVDKRYVKVYGCVYAIGDTAFCFAYVAGPLFSALIVPKYGFSGTVVAVALTSILFAPLLVLLRGDLSMKGTLSASTISVREDGGEMSSTRDVEDQANNLLNSETTSFNPSTEVSTMNSAGK